jgi:hypothetical protein
MTDKKHNYALKEARKLALDLKLEKASAEGIKKRCSAFEFELGVIKEEKTNLLTEKFINDRRILELESALNEERSKRLVDMHENEILKEANFSLEHKISKSEKERLSAQEELLIKIQKLETIALSNDSKSRIIQVQSTDLNNLTFELNKEKSEERQLHLSLLSYQKEISNLKQENIELKEELSRVRKLLVEVSIRQSDKSAAFRPGSRASTSHSSNLQRSLGVSAGSRSIDTKDFNLSFKSDLMYGNNFNNNSPSARSLASRPSTTLSKSFSSLNFDDSLKDLSMREKSISPIASPYRPQKGLDVIPFENFSNNLVSSSSVSDFNVSIHSDLTSNNVNSSLAVDTLLPHIENSNLKNSRKKVVSDQSVKPKTVYIGSGLGLKQEATFSPKGSAKMMLKKIMEDFNA